MKININISSFVLSLFCIPVFFIAISSANIVNVFTGIIGVHLLGVISLKDVRNWKEKTRRLELNLQSVLRV